MSTGGTGGRPLYGMSGASAAQQSVDLAENFDRDAREPVTGSGSNKKNTESHDKSFLATVKDALQPGDVKRRAAHEEKTHESHHGGILEAMKPGNRDDDESQKHHKRGGILSALKPGSSEGEKYRDATHSEGGLLQSMMPGYKEHSNKERRGSGILDALKPGDSRRDDVQASHHERGSMLDSMNPGESTPSVPGTFKSPVGGSDPGSVGQQRSTRRGSGSRLGSSIREKLGLGERPERNYQYDVFPSTEKYEGPSAKGEARKLGEVGSHPRTTPRTSAFDSQGTVGHQFSAEGNIGGTADRVGGPFSKEGVVGRQFTDTGSVGGTVQDKLGHGDATRRGK